jgi:hypothetical protein
MTVNEYLNSFI